MVLMAITPATFRLTEFDPLYAPTLVNWVRDAAKLRHLAPATDPPLTPAKVCAWYKQGVHAQLAWLEDEGLPVGYGEVNHSLHSRDQMWLGHILVEPAHRGQGVGRLFVTKLLEIAFEQHNAKSACLVVFPDNVSAIRCYESTGMRQVGPERWRHPRTGKSAELIRMEIDRKKHRALLAK